MRRWIKFSSLFLVFCMLVGLLAACKDEKEEGGQQSEEEVESDVLDIYDKTLYENETFNVMTIDGMYANLGVDGTVVEAALYTRDQRIQDYFDIDIAYSYFENNDNKAITAITNLLDGGYEMNAFITSAKRLVRLAMQGKIENLKNVNHLELENDWWCQALNQNCEFSGAQFVAAGPFSELFYHAALCLAYNNDMITKYEMPDIISMVDAGTWTLEEMYKLCTEYGVTTDLTGDGMNAEDQYAVAVSTPFLYGVYASCGQNFSTLDEEGKIEIKLATDTSVTVLEDLINLYKPEICYMQGIHSDAEKMFTAGRSLFMYNSTGYMIDTLPGSTLDYNIIPCPMYNEAQKNYVTCAWPDSNYCVAIQKGLSENDLGFSGLVLEAYCHLSDIYVKPAKYDTILGLRLAQNPDTGRMLDIIFDTLYFDLNLIFDFGGTQSIITERLSQSNLGRFTTLIQKASGSVQSDIQNLISNSEQTN